MSMYIILLLCLTPILLVALYIAFSKRRSRAIARKARAAFDNIYGHRIPPPAYEMTHFYGYPHFTVRFGTERELAAANEQGLNGRFSREIGEICKNEGTKDRPFRADLGIRFTSEEAERARQESYERQKIEDQHRPLTPEGFVETSQEVEGYRIGTSECSHRVTFASSIGFIVVGLFGLVIIIGMLVTNYQEVFSAEDGLVTLLEMLLVILVIFPIPLLSLAFPFMTKVVVGPDGLESHTLYYVLRTDWKNIDIVCSQGRSRGKIVLVIPRAGTLTLRKWIKPFRNSFKDKIREINIPVSRFAKSNGHTLEADLREKLGIGT